MRFATVKINSKTEETRFSRADKYETSDRNTKDQEKKGRRAGHKLRINTFIAVILEIFGKLSKSGEESL